MRCELRAFVGNAGAPCIIVTHSAREAKEIADQVCVIEAGSIVARGTPETVLRKGTSRFIDVILRD